MDWQSHLNGDPLPWLLESADPGGRFLALRDLLDLPRDDPELRSPIGQLTLAFANRKWTNPVF